MPRVILEQSLTAKGFPPISLEMYLIRSKTEMKIHFRVKKCCKKQRLSRQLCHKKMQNSNKQTVPPEGQVREMRWQLVQNDLVESVTKYYIKLFQKYYLVKPQKYIEMLFGLLKIVLEIQQEKVRKCRCLPDQIFNKATKRKVESYRAIKGIDLAVSCSKEQNKRLYKTIKRFTQETF